MVYPNFGQNNTTPVSATIYTYTKKNNFYFLELLGFLDEGFEPLLFLLFLILLVLLLGLSVTLLLFLPVLSSLVELLLLLATAITGILGFSVLGFDAVVL